jgi:hypothetical protein
LDIRRASAGHRERARNRERGLDPGQCSLLLGKAYYTVAFRGKAVEIVYRVSFFKTLFDSTGHRADPCQGTVEVRGESRDDALENARQRFAALKGITRWSLYADYHVIEELPARKRTSMSVWTKSIGDHAFNTRHR